VKGSFRFGKKQAAASKDAAAEAEAGSKNAKASEMGIAPATVASAPPAPAHATAEVLHDVDFGACQVRQVCVYAVVTCIQKQYKRPEGTENTRTAAWPVGCVNNCDPKAPCKEPHRTLCAQRAKYRA
jgi:hypothetical protein